eukprot:1149513-Pelagomonas_calceolata.AAC.1
MAACGPRATAYTHSLKAVPERELNREQQEVSCGDWHTKIQTEPHLPIGSVHPPSRRHSLLWFGYRHHCAPAKLPS